MCTQVQVPEEGRRMYWITNGWSYWGCELSRVSALN